MFRPGEERKVRGGKIVGRGGGKRLPLWVPVSEGVSRGTETGLVCDQGGLAP